MLTFFSKSSVFQNVYLNSTFLYHHNIGNIYKIERYDGLPIVFFMSGFVFHAIFCECITESFKVVWKHFGTLFKPYLV